MSKRYPCENHPDYSRWLTIKQRCQNPNNTNYHRYGAKGITVSPMFENFTTFSDYIASLPGYGAAGASLDRIDGNKGYEPGNLRWAARSTQTANQAASGKGTNKYTGVNWSRTHQRWIARITLEGKQLLSLVCGTQAEALDARNQYIRDNDLPHPIQAWIGE